MTRAYEFTAHMKQSAPFFDDDGTATYHDLRVHKPITAGEYEFFDYPQLDAEQEYFDYDRLLADEAGEYSRAVMNAHPTYPIARPQAWHFADATPLVRVRTDADTATLTSRTIAEFRIQIPPSLPITERSRSSVLYDRLRASAGPLAGPMMVACGAVLKTTTAPSPAPPTMQCPGLTVESSR